MSINGDDREEPHSDAEAGWPNAEQTIRGVDDPILRAALGEGLERSREIFAAIHRTERAGQRRDKKLDLVLERLDINDARADLMMAMLQAVGAKVGLTKADVEELQKAEHARRARDKAADADAAHTRTRLTSLEGEVRRVSQVELEPLAAKVDELENTETRRLLSEQAAANVIVQEALRARIASNADIDRETRAEARDERHHERDEKSKLRWWILGIVALVLASAASGVVGRLTGRPIPVELPAHKE
jgi:hypothetical protein